MALVEVDLLQMEEKVRDAFVTTVLGSSFHMKDMVSVLLAVGEPLERALSGDEFQVLMDLDTLTGE